MAVVEQHTQRVNDQLYLRNNGVVLGDGEIVEDVGPRDGPDGDAQFRVPVLVVAVECKKRGDEAVTDGEELASELIVLIVD